MIGIATVMLLSAWLPAAQAAMASAGEVTLSIGRSEIVREGKAGQVSKGNSVFSGDVIRTSGNGHVHIRFVDGAHVSVRPGSILHVEDYRYDAANPAASLVKFYLETGAVREVSGLAAESARDRFRLNTPLVAIGVKGTDFLTQVSPHSTVVFVNQGAISLSPLDQACQAAGVGPCNTAKTRELSASMSMNGTALVYQRAASEPVFQSVNSLKGADKITPILIKERTNADGTQATVADSKSPANVADVLPMTPRDSAAARHSLVWGRWGSEVLPGDDISVPFFDALSGNSILVGDGAPGGAYYILFRNSNVPDLLAGASGKTDFSLQQGVATYRSSSNERSAATVNDGLLSIDFSNHTYVTALKVSAPAAGAQLSSQLVVSSGVIDPKTGIFGNTAGDKTNGAVSLDIRQAGYSFYKPVGSGSLLGATLWGAK